jgi:SAM-dependent methyltransferase
MVNNYLEVVYNLRDKPYTDYPNKLANYLMQRYQMKTGDKFLELGCGRGDFLNAFAELGLETYAIDNNDYFKKKLKTNNFFKIDMTKSKLPFEENSFDIIYSKSFIEHFYYPEEIFKEVLRILKPGGKFINLTPDWKIIYKHFYDDYTHRTPFTVNSLRDIYLINGFKNVSVEKFKQLPNLWNGNYIKKFLSEATRIIAPNHLSKKYKWVRFSKEIMLLSLGQK